MKHALSVLALLTLLAISFGAGWLTSENNQTRQRELYERGVWQAAIYDNCGFGVMPKAFRDEQWHNVDLPFDCRFTDAVNKNLGIDRKSSWGWDPDTGVPISCCAATFTKPTNRKEHQK